MLGVLLGGLSTWVLVGTWLVLRFGAAQAAAWSRVTTPRTTFGWGLALALASGPLWALHPWMSPPEGLYWGDAEGHARAAVEIAHGALAHGWITGILAGFPLGHHYPPLSWLVAAAWISLGVAPATAVYWLGWLATLALPLVFFLALVRARAQPLFAFLGALCLCWVAPYNAFVGGFEVYFTQGLLSQAVALPLCLWWTCEVILVRDPVRTALWGCLLMAAHPQLALGGLVLLWMAALVVSERALFRSASWAAVALLFSGACLYGQGLATLNVPFGWPPAFGWRQLGFGPSHLGEWLLDGELLDRDRSPVLTALVSASLLCLLLLGRSLVARSVVVTLVAGLLLTLSGQALNALGAIGQLLLTFAQPLRLLAFIPVLVGLTLVVALEESRSYLVFRDSAARWLQYAVRGFTCVITSGLLLCSVPSRLDYVHKRHSALSTLSRPRGYEAPKLRRWLRALSRGRVWYDDRASAPLSLPFVVDGLGLASAVPVATTNAVGAHVGLMFAAYHALDFERGDSARRAEALGVRTVLHVGSGAPPGWREVARSGDVGLFEHMRPTDWLGVGCVVRKLSGSNAVLKARLASELSSPQSADALLDPLHLVSIELGSGVLVEEGVNAAGCDASAAQVDVERREPGYLRATVHTNTPSVVVLRETAFPGWEFVVDGNPARPTLVAPGFPAFLVGPGAHSFEAAAHSMPGYGGLLLVGGGGLLAVAVLLRRRWSTGGPPDAAQ